MKKSLNEHEYPGYFKRRPHLIKLLYATCYLSQFRKWYLFPLIAKLLRKSRQPFTYMDIGCGEGQFLFPFAEKYPESQFIAFDRSANNVAFYDLYIASKPFKNVVPVRGSIDTYCETAMADFIACIGVLHFVESDEQSLKNIYNLLKPGGQVLLQVPVNGRTVLPWYRFAQQHLGNYDNIQHRQRHYQQDEFLAKVAHAGLHISEVTYTSGFAGILAHELFNIPFLYYINKGVLHKIAAFVAFNLLFPFIMLLYFIDYCGTGKATGNGIIVLATKPEQ
ncbi:MAG: class I SAM-dependent methyltransferase [Chitinophagia bacterium]|nr:class I SAM-dependent methyltransferase [Chitinophagia bacterium]